MTSAIPRNTNNKDFLDSVKVLTDKNTIAKIIVVQKHMRRILACRRMKKMSAAATEKIHQRREQMKINPEAAALKEFAI